MFGNMFGPKSKQGGQAEAQSVAQVKPPPRIQPKADTVDLVPILAIKPPYLITKDGAFIAMFEIPPLESSVADHGAERESIKARFSQALASLPPGMKFQMAVMLEPVDPTGDLEYLMSHTAPWHREAEQPEIDERQRRNARALAGAGDYLMSDIATWYDAVQPVRTRTIVVLSWMPPMQVAKSSTIFGGGSKGTTITLDQVKSYLPKAEMVLGEQEKVMSTAFGNAGIPMLRLTPAQMCQAMWRSLHPTASGDKRHSAALVAQALASGQDSIEGGMPDESRFPSDITPDRLAELLAPDTFRETADGIEVDGVHCSGYVVWDFRPNQPATQIARLAELPGGWIGTIFFEVMDPSIVAERLRQREVQLSATENVKMAKGLLANFGDRQEVNAVQRARYDLETASITPINIRFFIARTAFDLETLAKRTQELGSLLKTISVAHFVAHHTQEQLFRSLLPTGRMALSQKPRNMTPDALSPFFWPEHRRIQDPTGIYAGLDVNTNLPVRIDPFGVGNTKTSSYLAIGRPGSGKSVWLRTMMTSAMLAGGRVMAIDIEGEMKNYCETYGGRYVDVGSLSGDRINILDIPPDAEDPLVAGTEQLISFMGAILNQPVKPGIETNALAEAYRLALEDRGWLSKDAKMTDWKAEDAPRLSDIYRILQRQNYGNGVGQSMADIMQPYAEGMYAQFFNTTTTFNIRDERLVIFGLRHISETRADFQLRVYLWQVMSMIWGEVMRRYARDRVTPNYVCLDEVWKLLESPGGGEAIENMARRFRKRRTALLMATQAAGEFLQSPRGKNILNITGNLFLMAQKSPEAMRLQELLSLSSGLARHLTSLRTGHGVLISESATLMLHVAAPAAWGVTTGV